MVTDTAYSGQDDILIFNSSSQRTVPGISDAALLKYSLNQDMDIYTLYRFGNYVYPDVAEGVHKTRPANSDNYRHDTFRPPYIGALDWRKKCDNFGFSATWQEDVASGQVSYIVPQGTLFFGAGRTGSKPSGLSGIDTDLGFPFDLSIDRNHNNMWSFQPGGMLNTPGNTFIGLAQVLTNGYEDDAHQVSIHGMGTNLILGYQPQDGLKRCCIKQGEGTPERQPARRPARLLRY